MLTLIIFLSSILMVSSLYEDQAGTFDWRQQYLGRIKQLINSDGDQIFVTTHENVLASINKLNGEIVWRHIFEKDLNGVLYGLLIKRNNLILTSGKQIVHCFNKNTGILLWETSIFVKNNLKYKSILSDNKNIIVASNTALYSLSIESGIAVQNISFNDNFDEIFLYSSNHGFVFLGVKYLSTVNVQIFSKNFDVITKSLEAKWITKDIGNNCKVKGKKFICFNNQKEFYILDLENPEKFEQYIFDEKSINEIKDMNLISFSNDLFAIYSNNQMLVFSFGLQSIEIHHKLNKINSIELIKYQSENSLAVIEENNDQSNKLKLIVYEVTKEELKIQHQLFIQNIYHPLNFYGKIWKNSAGLSQHSIVFVNRDDSLRYINNLDNGWIREEALASISNIEFVDLPVTKLMADLEDEFNTEESILGMFKKRFVSQIHQFWLFVERLKCKLEANLISKNRISSENKNVKSADENYLFRDEFNIHKIIVAMTAPGKLFGLDSNNGDVIWADNLQKFNSYEYDIKDTLSLFIQRCTSHYPHQPIASIIAKNRKTGETMVYSFDPITGQKLNLHSNVTNNVITFSMLPLYDNQFIHPIIFIDNKLKVSVYPSDIQSFVSSITLKIFQYVVDKHQGLISGYLISSDMQASLIWSVDLGRNGQNITKIASRRQTEKVHAVGIALEDRSVLYKYLNPNLLAVITEGEELQSKDSSTRIGGMFNVYLIDSVTGSIVFHCMHKKSHGPIHLVHSENWIVYSYWSEKYRRSELSVIELYEGGEQYNASSFTSLHLPPHPIAIRQAYIFPGQMSSIQVSISENGLTSKLLLFALENGAIMGLPKILIDPRRPEVPSHESREEGLIPYMPELPRPTDHIINYYRSVFRIKSMHTYPTGLESTSLVLASGLDLFLTRVTPSKMFDVLKEDFDYFFISIVLIAMIVTSFVSKQMASKKMLTKLWK